MAPPGSRRGFVPLPALQAIQAKMAQASESARAGFVPNAALQAVQAKMAQAQVRPRQSPVPAPRPIPASHPPPAPAIQCMIKGLTIDNGGIVSVPANNARWGHRPPTNAKGQQSHRTAYAAIQEGVRRAIHKKDKHKAAKRLRALLSTYGNLIGIQNARADLIGAIAINRNRLKTVPAVKKDAVKLLAQAGYQALAIRQMVPGSVGAGSRIQHLESNHTGALREYEKSLKDTQQLPNGGSADDIREHMWKLLDDNPPPSVAETDVYRDIWNHLVAMRNAYPKTFAYLGTSGSWLIPYLRLHQGEADFPFPRVPAALLQNVEGDLHRNWV